MSNRSLARPGVLAALSAGVVFVFGPALAGALGARAEAMENRPLAERPSMSAGWKVFEQSSTYVQDHLPVRSAAVRLHGAVVREVFREPAAISSTMAGGVAYPTVVPGRDGWLFYGGDFKGPCAPAADVAPTVDRLARLADILREAGKEAAVVVVPDKSTIAGSHLPKRYIGRACASQRKEEFWRAYAGRHPDLLDLRPALRQADAGPGGSYLPSDSHWTPRGALAYARALVEHVAPGTWDEGDIRQSAPFRKRGDLGAVVLEDRVDEVPGLAVERDAVRRTHASRRGHYTLRYRQTSAHPEDLVRGRTALIGDSFTLTSSQWWSPWFEQVTTRHRAETDRGLVLREMVESDTVLFEVVERDAAGGRLGLVDDAFLEELERRLKATPRSG